jgi:hypothetical protein
VPLQSSQARRFLIARSPSNLPASPKLLARRVKVLQVEVREFPEAKVVVADHLAVAVGEDVDVLPEVAVATVV